MKPPFPSVESLVPHRGPALLLERILAASHDGIECLCRVRPGAALADGRSVPSFVGLEAAAQGAAALQALQRTRGQARVAPRPGLLVSLRDAVLNVPEIELDTPFTIAIRTAGAVASLSVYQATVTGDGRVYAQAVLGTYGNPEPGPRP